MRQDECEWIDDVIKNIDNQNDNLQPCIATLRFDKHIELPSFHDNLHSTCYKCVDNDDNLLPSDNLYSDPSSENNSDNYIAGEILTDDIDCSQDLYDEPDSVKEYFQPSESLPINPPIITDDEQLHPSEYLPPSPSSSTWKPTLLPIIEESVNDLRLVKKLNDDGIWSLKRRTKDRYKKLSNKIDRMIQSSDGIYRVKVNTVPMQNDGGALTVHALTIRKFW